MISKKKCGNCVNFERLDDHFRGGLCLITDCGVACDHPRCKYWKGIKYVRKKYKLKEEIDYDKS